MQALAAVDVLGHEAEAVAVLLGPRNGFSREANTETPRKQTPRMPPIHIRVVAAFLLSGFLNAGRHWRPLRHPTARRRRTRTPAAACTDRGLWSSCRSRRRLSTAASPGSGRGAARTPGSRPVHEQEDQHQDVEVRRARRTAEPLSFTPRRLTTVISSTQSRHTGTVHLVSKPVAVRMASTPPATLTATVRM